MFEVVSQDTQFRQFLRSMFGIRLSYRALYYQAQLQSSVLTVRTDRAKLPETDRPQSDRASSFRAKPSPCLGTRERTQNLFILPWSSRKDETKRTEGLVFGGQLLPSDLNKEKKVNVLRLRKLTEDDHQSRCSARRERGLDFG